MSKTVMLLLICISIVTEIIQVNADVVDYALPPLAKFNPYGAAKRPFDHRSSVNLRPIFPLIHQFSNGIEEGKGESEFVRGSLNLPLPNWKAIWDMKGYVTFGREAAFFNYGHIIHPVNMLGLKPNQIMRLLSDPLFHEARLKSNKRAVPVGLLSANYAPLHCQLPMCNPFVSTFAFGTQSMPPEDRLFDILLDFPIRKGPLGEGIRFPLSGTGYFGEFPSLLIYGQHLNAVDPFLRLSRPTR